MKLFLTTISIFLFTISSAQKDSLWFDKNWKETTKENAHFYRIPIQKEGKLYRVKDFYINGTLQMSGLSKYKDSISLLQAIWYNEAGYPLNEINYEDAALRNGTRVYYTQNEDLTTTAIEELVYKEGDLAKLMRFDGDRRGIRYETYYKNNSSYKEVYYDKNGKKIGESVYDDKGYSDGKKVTYHYKPMRIKSITEYKDFKPVFTQYFYSNGIARNHFNQNTLTETFYDDQGNQLGTIQFRHEKDANYKTPYEGKDYFFTYSTPFTVKQTKTYKKGHLTHIEEFNKHGNLIKETEYTNGIPAKITSYNNQGKQIGVLEKIDDKLEGRTIEISGAEKKDITYKNGIVQEAITYYSDTSAVFSHLKNSEITYFDLSGKELGKLKVKLKIGYYSPGLLEANYYSPTPIEGVLFKKNYKNKITDKKHFSNEKLTEETTYTYIEDTNIYKETRLYQDRDLSKTITYYIDGGKKTEITYKPNSYKKKETATFYDKTGKTIGSFNYSTKTGTEYVYFYESDQVKSITEFNNDKLIKSKRYQKVYNRDTRAYNYILRENIDINSTAKFYSQKGVLIAQATYTNQKPTGTLYDFKSREEMNFINGVKEGTYRKFRYDEESLQEKGQYANDKKQGTFTYYQNDKIEKEENYKDGKKDGYAIYYDKNGKEISRLLYKNGNPFEGKTAFYDREKIYKDGALIKETKTTTKNKTITLYTSEDKTSTSIYDLQGNTLLTYNEVDHRLHGKVVQYKNNKPLDTAVFSEGKLTHGTVWIKADSRYRSEAYSQLSRENNSVRIKTYNKNGELLFKGEINPSLYKDYGERIISYKLNNSRTSIYRNDLFILEQPD